MPILQVYLYRKNKQSYDYGEVKMHDWRSKSLIVWDHDVVLMSLCTTIECEQMLIYIEWFNRLFFNYPK